MRWIWGTLLLVVSLGAEDTWKPYQFKGNERFEYTLVQVEEGEKTEGHYVIALSRDGEKYVIQMEGKFGEYEGSTTLKVRSGDEVGGALVAQMFFNPWLAPLSVTLFAQGMTGAMAVALTQGAEPGSKSVIKGENGEMVYRVESCEFQGKKGKRYVVEENGTVSYESCVVPEIALPIYVKMTGDEGNVYELKLTRYEEK